MGKLLTVKMPDIGEGVVEGEVIEWLKKVGEPLKQDEPVVVVMTDKATVELPAPQPGRLAKQYFQPGQIAVKDKPLYDIELQGEGEIFPAEITPTPQAQPQRTEPCPMKAAAGKTRGAKGLATPPVRHMAKQLNIDLSTIQGSGKDGRITVEDLKSIHPALPEPPQISTIEGDEEKPLIGIRRLMAERMKASNAHIPHFSYFEKVDATRLVALRERLKEEAAKEHISVTYMPLFIRALSLCIQKHPEMNSSFDEQSSKLMVHRHHNIGVAVAGPQGLVVAVLNDVQKMSLKELIPAYADLKRRAVEGKLQLHETKGSTITLSNFGVLGGSGLWATPIINYPEAAILAVDRIQKQPIVKNDEIAIREILNVSWSFDHRFIDGEMAAAISRDFCAFILNPAPLI